jgi:glucose/arabinose dehydrogenase
MIYPERRKIMRYRIVISIIVLLIFTSNVSAQFMLEDAFPNLSFNDPIDLQNSGDGTNRIFVAERAGIIKVFPDSSSVTSLKSYLDIRDRVSAGGEMGLLGLAFHPDYETNGYFYVNYTVSNPRKTRISRFQVSSENPDSADKNTELILLTFDQPYANHNGGWIGFGPDDGYLYIGTGDGGSAGDPQNFGQSIVTFLGKILRIDIDNQDPGLEYAIPVDNPFVDSTGSVVKEIYAWGMRNPWRNSFDPVTGWLWAADVGQYSWEEIDIIENGKNYGWRCYEGTHPFNTSGCNYPEYIDPVFEYSHSLGCSVTGGYVYRGPTVPELTGKYIYADYCDKTVWSLEYNGIEPPDNQTLLTAPGLVVSFGTDENNELYVITFSPDRIYRFSPSTTGIEDLQIPVEYKLEQNYPNPFNPNTNIKYQVGNDGFVSLELFNSLGENIATLVNEFKQAGSYQISFNTSNLPAGRQGLPSGVYIYILKSGNFLQSKKMILLK